jgi:sugar phosphate isomerase/epimerase
MLELSRRALLASSLATGLSACVPRLVSPAGRAFFQRTGLPIGLQLYTLGDLPEKDLEGTLKAVAAIGYRTVELPGFYGKRARELRTALDAASLVCASVHIPAQSAQGQASLDGDLDRLAADLRVIGAEQVVMPSMVLPKDANTTPQAGESWVDAYQRMLAGLTPDDWKANATFLNKVGQRLRQLGLKLAYHNHNYEFAPVAGTTGYDILLQETDASLVAFELDIGWLAAAGRDPIRLLTEHSGRFRLMHVKDIKASTPPNFTLRMDPTEVGSGTLDWQRVLPAAYGAGIRHFFVEQEPPFVLPRLESIAKSYAFLKETVA